jgi:hypothetical protein
MKAAVLARARASGRAATLKLVLSAARAIGGEAGR